MNTWTAIYNHDPDDDVWLVRIAEEERCHSWGKTLTQAKRHIRDAVTLWAEQPVKVIDRVNPPAAATATVDQYLALREQTDLLTDELSVAQMNAAGALRQAGLSMREAAAVLGISHQRVGQLAKRVPWEKIKAELHPPS